MIRYLVALLFFFSLLTIACQPDPNRPLTRAEYSLVDTLYRRDIDSVRISIENWCKNHYDSIYTVARDSILEVRIEEIQMIRSDQ